MLDIDRVLTEQEIAIVENSAEKTEHKTDKSTKGKSHAGKEEE
jgi:hypothetical protein